MNTENGNAVVVPQYEMFPSLFAGGDKAFEGALNIKRTENGTSITVKKRTGKTESLAVASGKTGDALKAWERAQRDKLKVQMNQVVSAAMASAEYTGGSMRMGRNGALSFRLAKVDAPRVAVINEDSILAKFSSEELQELAEKKLEIEAQAEPLELKTTETTVAE